MLTIAQVRPYWIKIVRETNHFEKERLFENLLIMQNPELIITSTKTQIIGKSQNLASIFVSI